MLLGAWRGQIMIVTTSKIDARLHGKLVGVRAHLHGARNELERKTAAIGLLVVAFAAQHIGPYAIRCALLLVVLVEDEAGLDGERLQTRNKSGVMHERDGV